MIYEKIRKIKGKDFIFLPIYMFHIIEINGFLPYRYIKIICLVNKIIF